MTLLDAIIKGQQSTTPELRNFYLSEVIRHLLSKYAEGEERDAILAEDIPIPPPSPYGQINGETLLSVS